jgi:hypothetical protein
MSKRLLLIAKKFQPEGVAWERVVHNDLEEVENNCEASRVSTVNRQVNLAGSDVDS